jgi:hypothetical protein
VIINFGEHEKLFTISPLLSLALFFLFTATLSSIDFLILLFDIFIRLFYIYNAYLLTMLVPVFTMYCFEAMFLIDAISVIYNSLNSCKENRSS